MIRRAFDPDEFPGAAPVEEQKPKPVNRRKNITPVLRVRYGARVGLDAGTVEVEWDGAGKQIMPVDSLVALPRPSTLPSPARVPSFEDVPTVSATSAGFAPASLTLGRW